MMTDQPDGEKREALQRIADTLGCSVEALTDVDRDPLHVKDLSELLSIWSSLKDDVSREKLLELARQIATPT